MRASAKLSWEFKVAPFHKEAMEAQSKAREGVEERANYQSLEVLRKTYCRMNMRKAKIRERITSEDTTTQRPGKTGGSLPPDLKGGTTHLPFPSGTSRLLQVFYALSSCFTGLWATHAFTSKGILLSSTQDRVVSKILVS